MRVWLYCNYNQRNAFIGNCLSYSNVFIIRRISAVNHIASAFRRTNRHIYCAVNSKHRTKELILSLITERVLVIGHITHSSCNTIATTRRSIRQPKCLFNTTFGKSIATNARQPGTEYDRFERRTFGKGFGANRSDRLGNSYIG